MYTVGCDMQMILIKQLYLHIIVKSSMRALFFTVFLQISHMFSALMSFVV